jgi:hypothetical protein
MLNREKIGHRLICFAWGVEIVAAFIGLTIAALIIHNTGQKIDEAGVGELRPTFMDMFLGGLPFIVVAMVELTKIPLATACYSAINRWWKTGFAVALIFLSIITFETILNGFERNFTQRTYLISSLKKEVGSIEEQIEKNRKDISELSQATEEGLRSNYLKDIDQLEKEKQAGLEDISKEQNSAKIRYGGEAAKVKNQQLKIVEDDLKALEANASAETANINSRYNNQIKRTDVSVRDQRQTLKGQIKDIEREISENRKREEASLANVREEKDTSGSLRSEIGRIEKDFEARTTTLRDTLQRKRNDLGSEISQVQSQVDQLRADLRKRLDEAFFLANDDALRSDFERRIGPLQKRLEGLQSERSQILIDQSIIGLNAERDRQISKAREQYAELGSRGNQERTKIREEFSAKRLQNEQQLQNLRGELASLTTSSQIDLATTKRDEELGRLKKSVASRRDNLLKQRYNLSGEIEQILALNRTTLEPVLNRLDERRASIIQSLDRRKQDRQQRHKSDLSQLGLKKEEIGRREAKLIALRDDRAKRRAEISRQAQDNQIYRITALWSGKDSPADITNDELRVVTIVWFGSLAAITAWTGTILAFGGLVVMYGPQERGPKNIPPVRRALRSLLIDWRRKVRRPIIKEIIKEVVKTVEVVKEVPVDKVVFRDVPKEIVRKELVYVPMFTDDPNLLKDQKVNLNGEHSSTNGSDKEP